MDFKKEIAKQIESMSGKYNAHAIFFDWVAMMALGIQNSCDIFKGPLWQKREKDYLAYAKKYNKQELSQFAQMMGMLAMAFDEEIYDYLGFIYMESGAGSKKTGQFFTPFHLSEMMARMKMGNVKEGEKVSLNEPSTGGGGMILAAAKALKERDINYQKCLDVVAQDLDWTGVYMTYVQCSLTGIKAIVVQGDTIQEPYNPNYDKERVLITPTKMGVLI